MGIGRVYEERGRFHERVLMKDLDLLTAFSTNFWISVIGDRKH